MESIQRVVGEVVVAAVVLVVVINPCYSVPVVVLVNHYIKDA